MVEASHHHRTSAVSKLAQQLGRLAATFGSLAEQQAKQEKARSRNEAADLSSFRKGLERVHSRMDHLEKAGGLRTHCFNFFDVIERATCEHTHSNVLAWLLDPSQAHGLGDAFLRAFVKATFREDLSATTDVVVRREFENCDIVICQGCDWVLVIENKVDSVQEKDQLF